MSFSIISLKWISNETCCLVIYLYLNEHLEPGCAGVAFYIQIHSIGIDKSIVMIILITRDAIVNH